MQLTRHAQDVKHLPTGGVPDNGGPPVDDVAKMRWVRVNISDILEGMDGLTWEQRGFYCTALFKMYARMDGIPAEEKAGCSHMRCDIRTFRRLRDHLLKEGKFYHEDGLLKNSRVEREIADFCREVKRRRDAAIEREKRRREAAATPKLLPNFAETSIESPAEVQEMFGAPWPEDWRSEEEKPNENNVCTATTVSEPCQNSGGNQKPETRNQKEEKEIQRKSGSGNGRGFWSQAMKVEGAFDPDEGVTLVDNVPVLMNGVRAKWLDKFGGDAEALDLALTAIAQYVQPNSSKGLKVSVESQLSSRLLQAKQADKRYERTSHRNAKQKGVDPAILKAQNEKIRREMGWVEEPKNG